MVQRLVLVTLVPTVAQGAETAAGRLMGETQCSFPVGFQEVLGVLRLFQGRLYSRNADSMGLMEAG